MNKNICLLLTSTVTPNISGFSGNIAQRKQEYLKALDFYLQHTYFDIVIVDNSDFDFSDYYEDSRLECLHYLSESGDSIYGKGYCEAKLMIYAFNNSEKLKQAAFIVKITGRHIVKNIKSLLYFGHNKHFVYADVDIKLNYAHSYFFAAPSLFYTKYLLPNYKKMNDSKGIHFEHVLAQAIILWKKDKKRHKEFLFPIDIVGHPGTSNETYKRPGIIVYIRIISKFFIYEFLQLKKIV